jgi:hypothetical protein
MNDNLETIIEDAVNDATYDSGPVEDTSPTIEDTPAPDVSASDEPPPDAGAETVSADTEEPTSVQVSSPGNQPDPNAPKDDFERLAGMPATGVAGRENRIPYSRVKKISEKAVNEVAEAALGRKLNPGEKAVDVVKAHVAQIPQLVATNKDYEQRLNSVGQFETVLSTQPQRFLEMLAGVPAYKEFFQFVEQAYTAYERGGNSFAANPAVAAQPGPTVGQQTGTPTPEHSAPVVEGDPMPEPDEVLADGSKQYSLEGVKQLLDWNSRQVTAKVTKDITSQFDERFKPMETEWQAQKRIEATLPVVRMQIAEARTWPLFNESENDIVRILESDKNISLEAAYRKVVFPKILAERTKIKQDVIQEMQRAPVASSAMPTRVATKPVSPNAGGPRNLEDVIKAQIDSLRQ